MLWAAAPDAIHGGSSGALTTFDRFVQSGPGFLPGVSRFDTSGCARRGRGLCCPARSAEHAQIEPAAELMPAGQQSDHRTSPSERKIAQPAPARRGDQQLQGEPRCARGESLAASAWSCLLEGAARAKARDLPRGPSLLHLLVHRSRMHPRTSRAIQVRIVARPASGGVSPASC